jgi:EAL domain-containing protein (putative c-di-GMP-specific phosphodiesterase class I)
VLPVSLNLAAQQLAHVDPDEVVLALAGGPYAAGALTVEVTETSMLGDVAAVAQVLDVFRDAGCRVAIDDFGTGHASIGSLRRLPLDRLKIDREFVQCLLPQTAEASFAAVIQGLADALELETVAEGVEHADQLAAVRAMGCDLVQGYLFSRGLAMPDLLDWAAAREVPALAADTT